jgi:hypothetical protein
LQLLLLTWFDYNNGAAFDTQKLMTVRGKRGRFTQRAFAVHRRTEVGTISHSLAAFVNKEQEIEKFWRGILRRRTM